MMHLISLICVQHNTVYLVLFKISYYDVFFSTACIEGLYGKNCSHTCPFTCQTCRNTDGSCSCKPGWMGLHCTTGDLFLNTCELLVHY